MKPLLIVATALACVSAKSKGAADVWLRIDGCSHLDSEGEPYVYAGIDTSYLPGTTKYLQSSIGKTKSGVTTFLPYNILLWTNTEDADEQKIETYLYGKDKFNPDDSLGDINLKLDKIDYDCIPVKRVDQNIDSDIFSHDATCDFSIALCVDGAIPTDRDGTEWATPAKAQTYNY